MIGLGAKVKSFHCNMEVTGWNIGISLSTSKRLYVYIKPSLDSTMQEPRALCCPFFIIYNQNK